MAVWVSTVTCLLLLTVALSSQQAPGDEDGTCVSRNTETFPDTVRNLMDSYNYDQLLRGNGTGKSGAVWTDRSVDGNDVTGTGVDTHVSINILTLLYYYSCHSRLAITGCIPIPVAAWIWRKMSLSGTSLWIHKRWRTGQLALHSTHQSRL